jgi:hypothetical protein
VGLRQKREAGWASLLLIAFVIKLEAALHSGKEHGL